MEETTNYIPISLIRTISVDHREGHIRIKTSEDPAGMLYTTEMFTIDSNGIYGIFSMTKDRLQSMSGLAQ